MELEYDGDYSYSIKITYDENGNVILVENSEGGYEKYEYTKVKW